MQRKLEGERREPEQQLATSAGFDRRVICLIDGDGTIFNQTYLVQGHQGGKDAAASLAKSIYEYMEAQHSTHPNVFLSVYVFLNKNGLTNTLRKFHGEGEKGGFWHFWEGFNQAQERFLAVDVGKGKEHADAKVKAFLRDNVRSPHTLKVFLGVCHDDGYVPDLQSLITDGYKDMLVLLPGYTEIASGIQELNLPTLPIPGLFMPEKMPTTAAQHDSAFPSPTASLRSIAVSLPPENSQGSSGDAPSQRKRGWKKPFGLISKNS